MYSSRRATVRRHTRRSSRRGESQPHRMSRNRPQLFGQAHSDWHLLSYLPRPPPHRLPGILLTPASMRTSDPHVSENVNQVAVVLDTPFHRERAVMAPAPNMLQGRSGTTSCPLGSASWPKQDRTKLRSHTRESAGGQPEPEYSTSQPLLGIWIELLQSLVESPINHLLRPAQALLCVGDANAELLGRLRSCKPLLQA